MCTVKKESQSVPYPLTSATESVPLISSRTLDVMCLGGVANYQSPGTVADGKSDRNVTLKVISICS